MKEIYETEEPAGGEGEGGGEGGDGGGAEPTSE